ncbi:MAG: hypothetical protein MMC23_000649 [Stictis urceolatum]|nr:hypothetical protein [Stictis urceolata]
MRYPSLLLLCAASVLAQSEPTTLLQGSRTITSDRITASESYQSYASTQTISSSASSSSVNSSMSIIPAVNTTDTDPFPTRLTGTNVRNDTATGTATSAAPTNIRPCNGYVEYCDRSYSNITYVAAHNSPFVQVNSAAANQDFDIFSQLNDGIRMLQGQTHMYNGELRYCHTSCDLLNAGTVEEYLTNATKWLDKNLYDVITILIGNSDFVNVTDYVQPIINSGIEKYLYEPPKIPMGLDDWPTIGNLILSQKRVILFMDYMANQTQVPYMLDEFSQLWETPFSPTSPEFPCTQQRPPDLSDKDAKGRMYMANHNLNVNVSLAGLSLLVPNTIEIDATNSNDTNSAQALGTNVDNCTGEYSKWNRPPNFLLVDYYNRGTLNGTVFAAAAEANNVTYRNQSCCGQNTNAAGKVAPGAGLALATVLCAAALII